MTEVLTKLESPFRVEAWIDALIYAARAFRLPVSAQNAKLAELWRRELQDQERVQTLARDLGLRVRFASPETFTPTGLRLPVIAWRADGEPAVITAIDGDGDASVLLAGEDGLTTVTPLDDLLRETVLFVIPRPARSAPDARVDDYIRPYEEHWFRRIVFADARSYGAILAASLVCNLLGLTAVLFSMQVYDRVVPAQSFPTLYVLYGGVLLGMVFEFALRRLRMNIVDILGKRIDLTVSDRVFGHALRVRNRAKPQSTGSFIARLRDLDHVREMLTSTTVSAVTDIPFFLLFLVVFWYIAGALVLVPLAALVLLVGPSLFAQRRLRAYASEAMRESSLRNAMLVEAVQGLEDIKCLQAEHRFQQQWNHYNEVAGEAQLRLRALTNGLSAWAHKVQNGVYVTIVFCGAPWVMNGEMTTGALVAASILGSRMMAPMSHLAQLLNRYQQAKMGMDSLNGLMELPVDAPDREHRLHAPALSGRYAIRSATFSYDDASSPPALSIARLDIAAGEKIAVLGRNGAGKSTLLQALSGLLDPVSGEVLLDDRLLRHIDPADVRRDVGLLTQNARLFHGTIRDNLTLGAPHASDAQISHAVSMVGADGFLRSSRAGLEHVVREGGQGLSGGQIQALLLARLLVRQPSVVLLDEPTAAMDDVAERQFIERFKEWSRARTVIIATHRMRVLDLVDRVIVVQDGAVIRDSTKDAALNAVMAKGGSK